MKGRKAKPTEVKIAQGNPGRRKVETVVVGGRKVPKMPAYLSPRAKTAWKNLVADMSEANILDSADWPLIEVAANAIAQYRQAVEMLQKEGPVAEGQKGNLTTSPYYRIATEQAKEIRQLLEHLGIGPTGRARLGLQLSAKKSMAAEMNERVGEKGLRVVNGGKA